MKTKQVIRTERGWPGHFICAHRCLFRRNTLLELGKVRIVVSTVGLMESYIENAINRFQEIGHDRYFETMVFYARFDGRYWDADVTREVAFEGPWCISEIDADDKANDMHETVVQEITTRMLNGGLKR